MKSFRFPSRNTGKTASAKNIASFRSKFAALSHLTDDEIETLTADMQRKIAASGMSAQELMDRLGELSRAGLSIEDIRTHPCFEDPNIPH